jgi:hypothetical protein
VVRAALCGRNAARDDEEVAPKWAAAVRTALCGREATWGGEVVVGKWTTELRIYLCGRNATWDGEAVVARRWYILFLSLESRRTSGNILSSKQNAENTKMETEIKREYWDNGKLQSETSYVGGVRHGVERWWWENGELWSEYSYEGGKRHGMMKQWWENGDIYYFCLWNQNEQVARFYPRNKTQRWKLK